MDKNTIIGFVLIGIVLFGFSWLNRPTPEQIEAQRRYQDSIAQIEQAKQAAIEKQKADPMASFNNLPDSVKEARLADSFGSFAKAMTGTEEFITLENEKVAVKLSTKGGRVISATLKEYDNYKGEPLVLFDKNESVFDLALVTAANQRVNTKDMYFTPIKGDNANAAVMRLQMNEGSYLDFTYTLQPNDYRMDFSIKGTGLNGMLSPSTETLGMTWTQDIRQQEKGRKFENRYVGLYYKVENDDVENLSETGNDSKNVNETLQWIGYKDMFFSTVLVAKEGFKEVKMDSRMYENGEYMKNFHTTATVSFDLNGAQTTDFQYFFLQFQRLVLFLAQSSFRTQLHKHVQKRTKRSNGRTDLRHGGHGTGYGFAGKIQRGRPAAFPANVAGKAETDIQSVCNGRLQIHRDS